MEVKRNENNEKNPEKGSQKMSDKQGLCLDILDYRDHP